MLNLVADGRSPFSVGKSTEKQASYALLSDTSSVQPNVIAVPQINRFLHF